MLGGWGGGGGEQGGQRGGWQRGGVATGTMNLGEGLEVKKDTSSSCISKISTEPSCEILLNICNVYCIYVKKSVI